MKLVVQDVAAAAERELAVEAFLLSVTELYDLGGRARELGATLYLSFEKYLTAEIVVGEARRT